MIAGAGRPSATEGEQDRQRHCGSDHGFKDHEGSNGFQALSVPFFVLPRVGGVTNHRVKWGSRRSIAEQLRQLVTARGGMIRDPGQP